MANATGNDPAAPARTATPASTGAQHALAAPENIPRAYAEPRVWRAARMPGIGSRGVHPASAAKPAAITTSPPIEKIHSC